MPGERPRIAGEHVRGAGARKASRLREKHAAPVRKLNALQETRKAEDRIAQLRAEAFARAATEEDTRDEVPYPAWLEADADGFLP